MMPHSDDLLTMTPAKMMREIDNLRAELARVRELLRYVAYLRVNQLGQRVFDLLDDTRRQDVLTTVEGKG